MALCRRKVLPPAGQLWIQKLTCRPPERAADRRDDVRRASGTVLRALGRFVRALACMCCLGGSARDLDHSTARRPRRGLPALRLALAELARHYRMPLG
jgi:hypothetical protein